MSRRICRLLSVLMFFVSGCGTLEVSVDRTQTPDPGMAATIAALQAQNAELATRIAQLSQPTQSLATPLPGATATLKAPTVAAPTRIRFLNEATVGAVSSAILPGAAQTYILDAFQGQPMFVYVGSPNSDVKFSMKSDSGTTIVSAAEPRTSWQGSLPQTGNYYITVHGGSTAGSYSLTVTLPLRIQFPQGADSATLTGKTVAGYDVSYAVYAAKGQTMAVDLADVSGKASLSIYGFSDGQRYLQSETGQKGFEFTLPSTQDYIVVVVPMADTVVGYTITVKIQ